MWYELTRGLAYPLIKHPSIGWYTLKIPLLISAATAVAFYYLPDTPRLLGDDGLFFRILGIVGTLPGFYFAALAAVATFDRPGMDNEIEKPAPTIDIRVKGISRPTPLSRRMFLSYLFSYLTTLSLSFCVLILALNALEPTIFLIFQEISALGDMGLIKKICKAILFFVVILPLCALAISTLHGIFFLAERVHQPYWTPPETL